MDSCPLQHQAIAEMEAQLGEFSSIDEIKLAELGRRIALSRARLRRLKGNGFCETAHGLLGKEKEHILDGYSAVLNRLLRNGASNFVVCMERLRKMGFSGSCSTVKRYIADHKHLVSAKRQQVSPQGNRGCVTPQRLARSTRWTGASQMCWTTRETHTVRHTSL